MNTFDNIVYAAIAVVALTLMVIGFTKTGVELDERFHAPFCEMHDRGEFTGANAEYWEAICTQE